MESNVLQIPSTELNKQIDNHENFTPPSSPNLALRWETFLSSRKKLDKPNKGSFDDEGIVDATPPSSYQVKRVETPMSTQDEESQNAVPILELLEEARIRESNYLKKKRLRLENLLSETITKQLKSTLSSDNSSQDQIDHQVVPINLFQSNEFSSNTPSQVENRDKENTTSPPNLAFHGAGFELLKENNRRGSCKSSDVLGIIHRLQSKSISRVFSCGFR